MTVWGCACYNTERANTWSGWLRSQISEGHSDGCAASAAPCAPRAAGGAPPAPLRMKRTTKSMKQIQTMTGCEVSAKKGPPAPPDEPGSGGRARSGLPDQRVQETLLDQEDLSPPSSVQETLPDQKIRPGSVWQETPPARNRSPAGGNGELEMILHGWAASLAVPPAPPVELGSGGQAKSGLPDQRRQETLPDQKIRPGSERQETPPDRNRSPAGGNGELEILLHDQAVSATGGLSEAEAQRGQAVEGAGQAPTW